jgi:hypothetical protein
MNGGALPALLVCAAVAIALANAARAVRARSLLAFVVSSTTAALVPMPAPWTEPAHFACWVAIAACGASAYVPNRIGWHTSIALAVVAGAAAGAVVALANTPGTAALLPLVAASTSLAARGVAQRLPIAPKVVASWLIAVALLAATLQILPVTPGYLPDHFE